MKPKEILRWSVVLLFGALGLYAFFEGLSPHIRGKSDHGWWDLFFILAFNAVVVGVPLAISYFAFRRQYFPVAVIFATIGALAVCTFLLGLPRQLGMWEFFLHHDEDPWFPLVGFPMSIISVFGPFFAAAWFLRVFLRLADRFIGQAPPQKTDSLAELEAERRVK